MRSRNQDGFSALDIILVIVAAVAIGVAVYFAVWGHKTTVTTTKTATIAKASPSPSDSPTGFQNLTPTASVQSQLTAAYVSSKGFGSSDITGPQAGSVYYAKELSSGTYWALVTQFNASSTASQQVLVSMQDGGSQGYFKMVKGGAWTVTTGTSPEVCAQHAFFPASLVTLWNLSTVPAGGC